MNITPILTNIKARFVNIGAIFTQQFIAAWPLMSLCFIILYLPQLTDQLTVCQKELHAQVQELDRLKKIYTDEESVAIDAREKASAAEEK